MSQTPDSAVRTYIEKHRASFLDDLAEWLRIPSVSAQPGHAGDVRRSTDWSTAKLKGTGFRTAEVWETPGAPAVFAEWPSADPEAPTVVRATGRAFEKRDRYTREGGSGPAADLQDVLGAPVPFLGISVPSDGWHASNEKVELDLPLKSAETSAHLRGDLADHWRHAP